METMEIVIPSRHRVPNMANIKKLVRDPLILVDEVEKKDYESTGFRIITHPGVYPLPAIRNYALDNVDADCIFFLDDDFECVERTIGKSKKIRDPDSILHILEQTHQVCADLNIGVWCYPKTANALVLEPLYKTFHFSAPCFHPIGIRGPARERRYDEENHGREDVDFGLQALLYDRILFMDARWHFYMGNAFSGKGGNVGVMTSENFEQSTQRLIDRWGSAVKFDQKRFGKKGDASKISVIVPRQSRLVKK